MASGEEEFVAPLVLQWVMLHCVHDHVAHVEN